jgi:hypothetical protein
MELAKSIKRAGVSVVGFLALLSMTAGAPEPARKSASRALGSSRICCGCKSDAKMGRHTALKVKRSVILLSHSIRSPQPRKPCPGQYHAVTACRRRASGVRAVANYSRCGLARTEGAAATLRFLLLSMH